MSNTAGTHAAKRRPDGEGSLFTTTINGRTVWTRAQTLWKDDGQRKYVRGSGATPQQASQRLAANLRKRINDGGLTPTHPTPDMPTLTAWTNTWINDREAAGRIGPASRRAYTGRLAHVTELIGDLPLDAIDAELIRGLFHRRLVRGRHACGDTARRGAWVTTKAALDEAVRRGIIDANPMRQVDPVRKPHSKVAEADARDVGQRIAIVKRWLDHLATTGDTSWRTGLLLLALGLRESEALGLTWDRVHLHGDEAGGPRIEIDRQITWTHGQWTWKDLKTRSSNRTVLLADPWVKALTAMRTHNDALPPTTDDRDTQLVWRGPLGGAWAGSTFEVHWHRRIGAELTRQGLDPAQNYFRPHAMRHLAASTLNAWGVPPAEVQAILGHSTANMTMRYTDATPHGLTSAMTSLGTGLGLNPGQAAGEPTTGHPQPDVRPQTP